MAFGFKTWNSDGGIAIDDSEVAVRFVATAYVSAGFNGTISVPGFDSTKGTWIVTQYLFKFDYVNDVRIADSSSLGGQYRNIINQFSVSGTVFDNALISTSWNNSTKVMTISTPSNSKSDHRIVFLHYK